MFAYVNFGVICIDVTVGRNGTVQCEDRVSHFSTPGGKLFLIPLIIVGSDIRTALALRPPIPSVCVY